MLCFIEATQILNRFNIRNKVLEIHCIQESENNENYRGLFQITTENKVYVLAVSDYYLIIGLQNVQQMKAYKLNMVKEYNLFRI